MTPNVRAHACTREIVDRSATPLARRGGAPCSRRLDPRSRTGLVQQTVQIVARFVITIQPYSLDLGFDQFDFHAASNSMRVLVQRGERWQMLP